jgi:hypothetical protein
LSTENLIYSPGEGNEKFSVVIVVFGFCETLKIKIPLVIFAMFSWKYIRDGLLLTVDYFTSMLGVNQLIM